MTQGARIRSLASIPVAAITSLTKYGSASMEGANLFAFGMNVAIGWSNCDRDAGHGKSCRSVHFVQLTSAANI